MAKIRLDKRERTIIVGKQIEKHRNIYLVLMWLISAFELILFIKGLCTSKFETYRPILYETSYAFLFITSLTTFIILLIGKKKQYSIKLYNIVLRVYSISILIWSLIISFLDMERNNMPIVYLTVVVTIAGLVVVEPAFFISLLVGSFILLIGLDSIGGFNYFVSGSEYINFFVYVTMAILISLRLYLISIKDFKAQETLEASVLEERQRVSAISLQTIKSISNAVDAKDRYTKEHSQRVAEYSQMIAKSLGWSEEKIKQIYEIGILHDIGKIGVPDSILNNTNKLTDEEFAQMKQHTIIGGEILKDLTILENVDLGAKYHHERWDGTGYPSGLKGTDIPIEARVIAVADAFDAMNSNRVYRNRLPNEKILSELTNGKGKQFDPEMIDAFLPHAIEILNNNK